MGCHLTQSQSPLQWGPSFGVTSLMRSHWPFVTFAALLPTLAGCSLSSDQASRSLADPSPGIYIEQVGTLISQGKPIEQKNYRQLLADCQASGQASFPLSSEQEAQLGMHRVQTWETSTAFTQRQEEWHLSVPGLCQFGVLHQSRLLIKTADQKWYTIDEQTGRGSEKSLGPDRPRYKVVPDDYALTSSAKANGWQVASNVPPFLGHACLWWKSPSQEQVCVWSEGQDFGYSPTSEGSMGGPAWVRLHGPIVFWSKPADGNGWLMQATRFVVGQPIPESVFQVPAGAQIESN